MNAMPNLRSVPHRANPSIPIEIDPFADPAPPSLYNQIVHHVRPQRHRAATRDG